MDEKKICLVNNRSAGMVVYSIPDLNIRRMFQPNETKKIPFSELEKLAFIDGGTVLIRDNLRIVDEEVLKSLDIQVEPEYWMDVTQVADLLKKGSLDALKDALDFAPDGVKDLIKTLSVSLKLNDVEKREAIKNQLGFDVTRAIEHQEESHEKESAPAAAPQRRVQQKTESSGRRATTPDYKVVGK